MARKLLSADSTIADVVPTLGDPEEYVRQVLGTLYSVRRKHGDVIVRIGITGTGLRPSYRVDAASTGVPISAFDGHTHRPFTDVRSINTHNWSTSSMTLEQVAQLRKAAADDRKQRSKTADVSPRR